MWKEEKVKLTQRVEDLLNSNNRLKDMIAQKSYGTGAGDYYELKQLR